MCGISGAFVVSSPSEALSSQLDQSLSNIIHRGPDHHAKRLFKNGALGHVRLSIIDTSSASNQPFSDEQLKIHLVFNGEIYNYRKLREILQQEGFKFKTTGDSEVLLYWFHSRGLAGLNDLEGFFAFCFYDENKNEAYLVRDRFGVKPLYYFSDEQKLFFSSELKGVVPFLSEKKIDLDALCFYMQLNYLPGTFSILKGINRISAGSCLRFSLSSGTVELNAYYSIDNISRAVKHEKADCIKQFKKLMLESVEKRLIADVPVGSFLSGGIDSAIVTGIASGLKKDLQTFSLGFKENKFYDEGNSAALTARHFGLQHHLFNVDEEEMLSHFHEFLNSIDEPFADSSAFNLFILSKKTSEHVKSVLSGDGADEVFGGYNKHRAEYIIRYHQSYRLMGNVLKPLSSLMKGSRHSYLSNKIRQAGKFSELNGLSNAERYWRLASFTTETEAFRMLMNKEFPNYIKKKNELLKTFLDREDMQAVFLTDVKMVLEGDMLVKVDRMSMAHGLEVRSPFMDHKVIEFGLQLHETMKLNSKKGKLILREAFGSDLPAEILNMPKKGFEVPLLRWLRGPLYSYMTKEILSKQQLEEDGIFNVDEVNQLLQQLNNSEPGDAPARLWALIIFNHWYNRFKLGKHA